MDNQQNFQSFVSDLPNKARTNPGMTLIASAIVIVLGLIIVFEINQSLTSSERANMELLQAASLADFKMLEKKYKGQEAENLIILEKLLFLVRNDDKNKADYAEAVKVLDEINDKDSKLKESNIVFVYSQLLEAQVAENFKFEEALKKARKTVTAKKSDTEKTPE